MRAARGNSLRESRPAATRETVAAPESATPHATYDARDPSGGPAVRAARKTTATEIATGPHNASRRIAVASPGRARQAGRVVPDGSGRRTRAVVRVCRPPA